MKYRKIKLRKNKQVINKLKKYYKAFLNVDAEYRHGIRKLEEKMKKEFKSSKIEFSRRNGKYIGIDAPNDSIILKLIQFEELEN